MHTAEAVVFARMPSGRDSPKTPSLVISPRRPKCAAYGVFHTRTENLPSGVFFASLKLTDRFGDLGLYQENLIAIWVLKIKPLYSRPRAEQVVFDFVAVSA